MSERDVLYNERMRCATLCRTRAAHYRAQAQEAETRADGRLAWAYRVAANALIEAEADIYVQPDKLVGPSG